MQQFPVDKLRPLPGWLWGADCDLSITVPLHPFSLAIGENGSEIGVETALELSQVELPSGRLDALDGQTFAFPVNPEDGYIDGSICIEHAHHPVDVSAIRFGLLKGGAVEVELEGELILEFEGLGDFANTRWVCRTHLTRSDSRGA